MPFKDIADPDVAFRQAVEMHFRGNVASAAAIYRQLLGAYPPHPAVLDHLGVAELQMGHIEEGIACFHQSLKLMPDQPTTLSNLGSGLMEAGRFDEALVCLRKAAALDPGKAGILNNVGNTLNQLGRLEEAADAFGRAIAADPNFAPARLSHANVLVNLSRNTEALACADAAIARGADEAVIHSLRGSALKALGRFSEALVAFDRALARDPGDAVALSNKSAALLDVERWDEALVCCDRVLALDPNAAHAWSNRCVALIWLKRPREAIEAGDRAIAINPGLVEACWNKALALLVLGDYAEGWQWYEWRWTGSTVKHEARDFASPRWTGETPIAGKTLLLHAEQGLGDTVQFCRYVLLAEKTGARIVLEAPDSLLPLLAGLKAKMTLVAKGQPLPAFDFHCPLMSLPLAFKTTLQTIPADVPYLFADAERQSAWRKALGDKTALRIGLSWSGKPTYYGDGHRSIPLERLAPLLQLPFEFHILQTEIRATDEVLLPACPRLHDHRGALHDFADTAALISELDLVISVDTVAAHVAGALGKPVWVLLPWASEWRWLMDRRDSPWYPTAELFRQPADGDWQSVIGEVVRRLEQRA